jgi:hypothetical protein
MGLVGREEDLLSGPDDAGLLEMLDYVDDEEEAEEPQE